MRKNLSFNLRYFQMALKCLDLMIRVWSLVLDLCLVKINNFWVLVLILVINCMGSDANIRIILNIKGSLRMDFWMEKECVLEMANTVMVNLRMETWLKHSISMKDQRKARRNYVSSEESVTYNHLSSSMPTLKRIYWNSKESHKSHQCLPQ